MVCFSDVAIPTWSARSAAVQIISGLSERKQQSDHYVVTPDRTLEKLYKEMHLAI